MLNPGPLADALLALDVALTGVDRETARNQQRNAADGDDFMAGGREYYLGDGGYSRVCIGNFTGRLFLTSNSTDRVKARWPEARRERAAVQRIVRHWRRDNV